MDAVHAPDGTKIAVNQSGEGPPVVLVHGTSEDHTAWDGVRRILDRSFSTYTIDRRGRGGSGDANTYALDREFEDVIAVIDSIGEPVHLVGHSYGATCALGAAMGSDALERLVLFEPPLWTASEDLAPEEPLSRIEAALDAGNQELALERFMVEVAKEGERLPYYRSLNSWAIRVDAAHTLPREIRSTDRFRPDASDFGEVHVPALVILGAETQGHLPKGTRRAETLLSNSTLTVVEGIDHSALFSEPELVATVIYDFLSESR